MGEISTLITDIRSAMAATWTDTPSNGIMLYEHIEAIPWSTLTPPFGGILISKGVQAEGWGNTNFAMTFDIEMVRVAKCEGNTGYLALISSLEDLWKYLIDNRPAHNTLLGFPMIDWGDEIPGNAMFVAKNTRHRAGRLTMRVLLGYSA